MNFPEQDTKTDFEQAGRNLGNSVVAEFVAFLGSNKRWWMTPILVVFGLLTVLAVLSTTAAAPFIYSLF